MSEMPEEPLDSSENIIKLAFRLPNGNRVFRNFSTADHVSVKYFQNLLIVFN
jgi:hypothetical protein